MPEMPEVQGLVDFLHQQLMPPDAAPAVIAEVEVLSFSVLKTAAVPLAELGAGPVSSVGRRGKFLVIGAGEAQLVIHLARAGWLRWSNALKPGPLRPGAGPIAVRVRFAAHDGSGAQPGFDLTEAGTRKSLAVHVVHQLEDVPGIARLGPEALDVPRRDFARMVAGYGGQIKGLLRDQTALAGIGNAYSDEVLHAARISPFAIAGKLDAAAVDQLFDAMHGILDAAVADAAGRPASQLKDSKRSSLRVHARAGEDCPVCDGTIREVSFADSSLQYCPGCQTGGKLLADRRTSRFLK
ncbi:DNA-formamidopyrimidine glycosylase family protein [Arthrobacter sp.]|uniref:DNA-formamidopyrimidine glycosylase family protein n=1 Tax=Arthrobacter sp. TaxID=1667 RepID=UPI003A8EAF67